jgi:hypothetical protein
MCTCQNSPLPEIFELGRFDSAFTRKNHDPEESFLTISSTVSTKQVNLCVCKGFYLSAKSQKVLEAKTKRGGLAGYVFESDLSHPDCDLIINSDGTGIGIGDIRDMARKSYLDIRFDLRRSDMEVYIFQDATGNWMMTLQFEIGYQPVTTPAP